MMYMYNTYTLVHIYNRSEEEGEERGFVRSMHADLDLVQYN